MQIQVKQLNKLNSKQLSELEAHEKKAFGKAGLNHWLLPVIAHYGYLYVLLIDGMISGCASFILKKDIVFMVGLWIKNKLRKNGFGEKLLKEALSDLTKTNANYVELTVQKNNVGARKLYKKMGFEIAREIKDYYGPNQSRLLLSRNLLK